MTQEQIQKISDILDSEEERVRQELAVVAVKDPATPEGYQPKIADYGGEIDEDDTARKTTDSETNTALEHELKHHLDAILTAREKLKKGHYGLCEKCGVEIPFERLQAMPATPYCIKCSELESQ
ncbi:MAG: DnaK suppressor protein [Parcubacteria group bacterium GW2011_GWA1_47_11]|uniref:Zinc finger DksA/TraR C4-type domain-containing protein n=1 Tax=Candidatus Yanofskybacteria bacterium RIFCSPHIGHO2_01_FULL_48_25b TaxID=1802672 RepID=A0A1F8F149_9BACT|nr:MAG: DnaK suppressor protein [Parcubacteria group bacterium GW2011_GWA1_47_11]OGN06408.1 MAG: hypothetical protein A2669_01425 [Candidatus Yanofskybacteria bacterium RIFCSPHIGHO2_01_FULL_48_25b]